MKYPKKTIKCGIRGFKYTRWKAFSRVIAMNTPCLMKCIPVVVLILLVGCKTETKKEVPLLSYEEVHDEAILVDTHNDILLHTMEKGLVFDGDLHGQTHTDLRRLREGGVDVNFFSIWCDGSEETPFDFAMAEMDSLALVLERNPDKIVLAPDTRTLEKVVEDGKIAAIYGIEGGHMIEDDLEKLTRLYERGARYMTLTWNNSTAWASSAADETSDGETALMGLTDFGKQVVQRMNTLGMMVDVSHIGEQTFWDVIRTTSKPVIASHSSVHAICPHPRNLKDEQIKAIAKNGGVVQLNFYTAFLDPDFGQKTEDFMRRHQAEKDSLEQSGMHVYLVEEYLFQKYQEETDAMRPPLSLLMDHMDHIVQLVGPDYVGLGSDFDGITSAPQGLDDVTSFPLITQAMLENGYAVEDIHKILGGNLLRVLKANEPDPRGD